MSTVSVKDIVTGPRKKSYGEKLKDPRWQKKRLEILQRDNFTCRACESDTDTLHVHHVKYTSNDPWNELGENLVTLCDECHKTWHYIYDSDLYTEYVSAIVRLYETIEYDEIQKAISNGRE